MNTHNNTHYRTKVGTFQLKYSHGGKLGSYSCKLSDIKPKKPYIWTVSAQELIFMVLRANRAVINQTIITCCSLSYIHAKKEREIRRGYIV